MKFGVSVLAFALLAGALAGCAEVTRTEPAAAPRTTTVVVPPGTTVVVVQTTPWCGGAYAPPQGTNFGGCPAASVGAISR
jgi:hypothetical protein